MIVLSTVIAPWADPQAIFETLDGSTPFFGIALTFGVYYVSTKAHAALGAPIFLHPLLISIAFIAGVLEATGIGYQQYYQSAEPLHLLLGPVVVLLAVPLWRQLPTIRDLGPGLLVVLFIGAIVGIATSAGLAMVLEAPDQLVSTLAPKSVTTPVAIELSESLGGVPAITALIVILTGLVGATIGWPLLKGLGIRDVRAKGFAIGIAAHVIGTARVFQIDQQGGAFSSLGMILNALMTAVLIGAASVYLEMSKMSLPGHALEAAPPASITSREKAAEGPDPVPKGGSNHKRFNFIPSIKSREPTD